MKKTIDEIHLVLSKSQFDEKQKEKISITAEKLNNECGCETGAFFLIATSLLLTFTTSSPFFTTKNILLIVFSMLLGKLLGKAISYIKLIKLLKTVRKREFK